MDYAVAFATGAFPYATEFQAVGMALQGAVAVRVGPNRNKTLHWFHAFVLSVMAGFAGGMLGFIWMGKPSSMLSSDINLGSCILAFIIVNYIPSDLGLMFCQTLPVKLIITSAAQLFRGVGMMRFIGVCYEAFKDTPSKYYPMPVFGPILYGILLGNMSGFLMKGLEGHVRNGVPWPVQNALFCATFFHFFVNDKDGPLGAFLRSTIPAQDLLELSDREFAACVVTYFMQVVGILQLPDFLGPSFTPFGTAILSPWKDSSTWAVGKVDNAQPQGSVELDAKEETEPSPYKQQQKKKKKKKGKVKST